MAAVVELHTWIGSPLADGGAFSSPGGIDLISADNAGYSSANRLAYPLSTEGVNSLSYEKWIRAHITTLPDNWLGSFTAWPSATIDTSTSLLKAGSTSSAPAGGPVQTTSSVAYNTFNELSESSPLAWDASYYSVADLTTSPYSKFLVFQLQILSGFTPGNWGPVVIYYEYLEA